MQHECAPQMQREGAQLVWYQPNTLLRSHEKYRGKRALFLFYCFLTR